MKKIWMLAEANLRKSKSQTASLLAFTLIAALLLNIGLVLYFGVTALFDKRVEENRAAHFTAIYSDSVPIDNHMRYIENYPGVIETQKQSAIGGFGDYTINDVKNTAYMYFAKDEKLSMDAPASVGDSRPLEGDAILIPYFMILTGGYKPGDSFRVELSGTELTFTVAGGAEEMMFGAQMNTLHRFYISDEKYDEMQRMFPDGGHELLSARFENIGDQAYFYADYNKDVSSDGLIYALLIDNAKQARTFIPLIAAMVVTAFSIILLIVSLIVIHFRIVNSIEESMTNIGALKSMGYRNRQIVASIVAQHGCVALAGAIMGIALSYAALPMIANMLKPLLALTWNPGFDTLAALAPLLLILGTVALISYASARKINKLHPLAALRGGAEKRSYKKNALPLDKTRGSLNLLFAMKQLMRNKKQAVIITIIIAAVTMASVAGMSVNYNMNEGREGFARALFGELPDLHYRVKPGVDGEAFRDRLLRRDEVRKAYGFEDTVQLLVDDTNISAAVSEDCSLMEGNQLIEGRYPADAGEIALGTTISKVSGKTPGDTVVIKSGDNEAEYLVTGIVQYMNSNGFNGIITGGGYDRVQPGFEFLGYNIYLTGGADVKEFIRDMEADEGDIFDGKLDSQDQLDSMLGTMSGIFAAVAIAILAVTICVVALTLYIVIKTTILRRRHELGIQKALGFTTFQLMNQITLNMTPVILAGAAVGAVAGYFCLNPMMSLLLGGMGIVQTHLPSPLGQTVIVGAALIALAYAVSMLISWRIRKISAYSLVSE